MDLAPMISQWLESEQDYQQGLYLLSQASKHKRMYHHLSLGETKQKKLKLEYELKKCLKALPPSTPNKKKAQIIQITYEQVKGMPTPAERIEPQAAPSEIQDVISRRKKLYKESTALHAQLTIVDDDLKRHQLAKRIYEIRNEEIPKLWQIEDKWRDTGQLELTSDLKTPEDLRKHIKNIGSNISKTRRKMEGSNDARNIAKWQKRIEEWELEREELKEVLCQM